MTNDEWYERERAAFIAWWESEGQAKFGATPTLAAGAGWLAKAEAVRPEDSALMSFEARATELEGYVSDRAKQEQRHLEAGTIEREYWHYGYLMALRDVLKRCQPQLGSTT
jgi:hypothetical protein